MRRNMYEVVGIIRRNTITYLTFTSRTADWTTWRILYERGQRPPRFPVPAIPVRTGYMPTGAGAMRGVPYIWLMYGYNRLTTFWKGYDPILEWIDTNGARHIKRIVSFK